MDHGLLDKNTPESEVWFQQECFVCYYVLQRLEKLISHTGELGHAIAKELVIDGKDDCDNQR